MSKGPAWMPLNVADYLKATHYLTVAEHGAYLLLILHYWQEGGLPESETLIMRIAHLSAEQWIESRPVLAALFDEGWKHKRIDAELAKAAEIIDKRRSAAEQRHTKSKAYAMHMDSTSSYAGVPPLPKPLPTTLPSSVPDAASARVEFDDVWEAFPQNPSSSREKAHKAFDRINATDAAAVLAAAIHYAKWFGQDCEARGRTVEAGSMYVPHLSKWLDSGSWREVASLPLKAAEAPAIQMVRLDREKDADLWRACEKVMGKKVPTDGMEWSFMPEIVEKARAAA